MLALVFAGGCCSSEKETENVEHKQQIEKTYKVTKTDNNWIEFGLHTIEYEGCEYIIYKDNSRGSVQMIHKENCKYCKKKALVN